MPSESSPDSMALRRSSKTASAAFWRLMAAGRAVQLSDRLMCSLCARIPAAVKHGQATHNTGSGANFRFDIHCTTQSGSTPPTDAR